MKHSMRFGVPLAAVLLTAPACTTKPPSLNPGIDLAGIDKSVPPGDDFNAYTNGAWIKSTPIPSDKSSYGIDAILTDETRKRTLSLIENASKNSAPARMRARSAISTQAPTIAGLRPACRFR
jgi:predicted metalloendopeptidase